jgi:hypothetical protein
VDSEALEAAREAAVEIRRRFENVIGVLHGNLDSINLQGESFSTLAGFFLTFEFPNIPAAVMAEIDQRLARRSVWQAEQLNPGLTFHYHGKTQKQAFFCAEVCAVLTWC